MTIGGIKIDGKQLDESRFHISVGNRYRNNTKGRDVKESTLGDTQRQRLEAREEAILAAAASLFSESGVDGTRMAEIARKADVAEGTVYLYYKNKHELWRPLSIGFGGS